MISNIYNTESLKTQNEELVIANETIKTTITENQTKIVDVNGRIEKGQEYRDNLLKSKVAVEKELTLMNPEQTQREIDDFKRQIDNNVGLRDAIKIVEPSEFYNEENHDKIKEEYQKAKERRKT